MPEALKIQGIEGERMKVPIVGTSPLIVSKFSTKAKTKMLATQQGRRSPKETRDPQADYEASLYKLDDGRYGFPATAFKLATVSAARFYGKDVSMKGLLQFIFFHGELSNEEGVQLVPIEGEPKLREDMVRLAGPSRGADLRYRGEFRDWRAVLDVTYIRSALDQNSVLSLIDAGGMGVGVGEWRPERKGDFGTYTIDTERQVEVMG